MRLSHLIIPLSILTFTSCAAEIGEPGGGDDNSDNGDCADEFCPQPDATPEVSCDEVRAIEIEEPEPPDLLLVVDRSGSMGSNAGGAEKWATMRDALGVALAENIDEINFGLMLYPQSGSCGAGEVSTPVGPGSNDAINATLQQTDPDGLTPTHSSLENALTYYESTTVNPNGRYVLLATDGKPNCTSNSEQKSVNAIAALYTADIPTFVLGFGSGVDASTLQEMADAGGQSQYYSANSPTELEAALAAIASNVALPECEFSLGEVPADPTRLRLYFDDVEVARSSLHTDGWDWDETTNTLTIYGTACDELQSGTVDVTRVDYGCQGTQID